MYFSYLLVLWGPHIPKIEIFLLIPLMTLVNLYLQFYYCDVIITISPFFFTTVHLFIVLPLPQIRTSFYTGPDLRTVHQTSLYTRMVLKMFFFLFFSLFLFIYLILQCNKLRQHARESYQNFLICQNG